MRGGLLSETSVASLGRVALPDNSIKKSELDVSLLTYTLPVIRGEDRLAALTALKFAEEFLLITEGLVEALDCLRIQY